MENEHCCKVCEKTFDSLDDVTFCPECEATDELYQMQKSEEGKTADMRKGDDSKRAL